MNRMASLVIVLSSAACGQSSTHEGSGSAVVAGALVTPAPTNAPESGAPVADGPWEDDTPPARFPDGARAFAKIKETLLANYYAEGITEDDLYRAAATGMLERLEPKMKKWNRLMTPREHAEMQNDLRGEVVGIGVHIAFDTKSGQAEVLSVMPGSPSEKVGLVTGDRILTVNGKLFKGMSLREVVESIRGKAGEAVTVSVLRGDKLLPLTVVRARVPFDTPSTMVLPDGVGYLRIPSFTDKTPASVRTGLEALARKNMRALVVDLRGCPGGSFDRAVDTAGALLADGAPIVTLKRRGKPPENYVAKGGAILGDVPLAVVVDSKTGSSAELVAAALEESRRARVVGTKTLGKWTVQSVDDLPNGWAFKYTVSLFKTPNGRSFEGVGLTPDVEVSQDEKVFANANSVDDAERRLAIDVQLRTAKELLAHHP